MLRSSRQLVHSTARREGMTSGVVRSLSFVAQAAALILGLAGAADAKDNSVQIVAALSLTGPGNYYGLPILDGVRLAVEEANADPRKANVELKILDDQSSGTQARQLAKDICEGPAVAAVGPALTTAALLSGPAYADCGLVSIPATAHGDDVPKAATTFQPVFNGGEMGAALAVYLKYVLNGQHAVVLYRKDGYGTPVRQRIRTRVQAALDPH